MWHSYDESACRNEDKSLNPQCDEYGSLTGGISADMMDVTRM